MIKERIAGFMLGLSVGYAVCYFIKPWRNSGLSAGAHARDVAGSTDWSARLPGNTDAIRSRAKAPVPLGRAS